MGDGVNRSAARVSARLRSTCGLLTEQVGKYAFEARREGCLDRLWLTCRVAAQRRQGAAAAAIVAMLT